MESDTWAFHVRNSCAVLTSPLAATLVSAGLSHSLPEMQREKITNHLSWWSWDTVFLHVELDTLQAARCTVAGTGLFRFPEGIMVLEARALVMFKAPDP